MPQTKLEKELLRRKAEPTTPGEAKYRDLVSDPTIDPKTGLPPVPGLFVGSPPVVGEELQRTIDRILRVAPSLRGKLKSAIHGPNENTMMRMTERNLDPMMFSVTNLLGNAGVPGRPETYGKVAVSPRLRETKNRLKNTHTLRKTTAHELAHVAGYDELISQLAGRLYEGDDIPPGIQNVDFGERINSIIGKK